MITEEPVVDARGGGLRRRLAGDDADRARLRHEATMLTLARHPGVVEIARLDADGTELVTTVGSAEPFDARPRRPDQALVVLAAVGEIVADLHALGLVHGGIDGRAILVAADGRPRLDRFEHAGLAGEPRSDGTILRPSLDVEALARLVSAALDASSAVPPVRRRRRAHAEPPSSLKRILAAGQVGQWPPARRLARAIEVEIAARYPNPTADTRSRPPARLDRPPDSAGPRGSAWVGDRLGATESDLADGDARGLDSRDGDAQADRTAPLGPGSDTRPSPSGTAPAPAPAGGDDPSDPFAALRPAEPTPRRGRTPRLLVAGAIMVGVVALTWGALVAIAGRTTSPGSGAAPSSTHVAPRPVASRPAAPNTSSTGPVVTNGGLVTVGSTRYSIGLSTDQVAIADWRCDGSPGALVLRPATGELFVFVDWATAGRDVTAQPAGRLAAGSRLVATPDGHGCARLSGIDPAGRRTPIDPGGPG